MFRDSQIADQVGLPEQNLDTSLLNACASIPRFLRRGVD
jgi:hypothetical protein